jgi:hypothetical protein
MATITARLKTVKGVPTVVLRAQGLKTEKFTYASEDEAIEGLKRGLDVAVALLRSGQVNSVTTTQVMRAS